MPPNYRQQQGEALKPHERKGALIVASVLVAAAAGIGVWQVAEATGGNAKSGKCVSVPIASSTGGGTLSQCGSQARSWCAAEAHTSGVLAGEIRAACRKEGFTRS